MTRYAAVVELNAIQACIMGMRHRQGLESDRSISYSADDLGQPAQ
jgi:hypothetical protein